MRGFPCKQQSSQANTGKKMLHFVITETTKIGWLSSNSIETSEITEMCSASKSLVFGQGNPKVDTGAQRDVRQL